MNNSEKDFLTDIKKHLDESVDNLDGASLSRLNQIRNQALDSHDPKRSPIRNWLWAGGAALPALALGLLVYFGLPGQHYYTPQTTQVATSQPEETPVPYEVAAITTRPDHIDVDGLRILMGEEELEMLSDLDFLTWLNSEDEVGG